MKRILLEKPERSPMTFSDLFNRRQWRSENFTDRLFEWPEWGTETGKWAFFGGIDSRDINSEENSLFISKVGTLFFVVWFVGGKLGKELASDVKLILFHKGRFHCSTWNELC